MSIYTYIYIHTYLYIYTHYDPTDPPQDTPLIEEKAFLTTRED